MLSYDEHIARQRAKHDYPDLKLNRKLRDLVEYCTAGQRVLDIACGSGRVMAALREKGCGVRGIDLSPGAVAACRAKGLNAIEGNVDAFQTDKIVRECLLASYDVIIFSKCLNYLKEKNMLMPQIRASTIFIHQNNPGYWREIVRRKFGGGSRRNVEELPYVTSDGTQIRNATAPAIRRWGESFGYLGTFVAGGGALSSGFLLRLEKK